MSKTLKKVTYDLILIFLNYFVAYIPCWAIRKCFYLLFGLKINKGSRINQRVFIYNPWNIRIGSNTIINAYTVLDGRGCLTIGNNTTLSMRTTVYTASHKTFSEQFEYYEKPTSVGDCCWICVNAVVLPGSEIKDMAIISANSVFKGVAKEKGIYAGNPAIQIRERDISKKYDSFYKEYFT